MTDIDSINLNDDPAQPTPAFLVNELRNYQLTLINLKKRMKTFQLC